MPRFTPRQVPIDRSAAIVIAIVIAIALPATRATAGQVDAPDFVRGGLMLSISERALADAIRLEVEPAVRDSLAHALSGLVGMKVESLLASAAPTGGSVEILDTHDATFEAVHFDPSTMALHVSLASSRELHVIVDSGPLAFDLSAKVKYGNCLFGACFSARTRFEVRMANARVAFGLTPEQLLNGVGAAGIPDPKVDIAELGIDFGTPHLGGVLGWATGASIVGEFFNLFGVPGALLDATASKTITSEIAPSLANAVTGQLAMFRCDGLRDLDLVGELPDTAPVRLAVRCMDPPDILAGQAITLAVQTSVEPRDAAGEAAPSPLATSVGAIEPATLGGDLALAASCDAVNQLLDALVGSGGFSKARFGGIALGDIAPDASFPEFDISPESPILVMVEAARDTAGLAIAPQIRFVDDPATAGTLELAVRARLLVRGILERGQSVPRDSVPCSCFVESADSLAKPCLLYELPVDLRFLVTASLTGKMGDGALGVHLAVAEVQLLETPGEPEGAGLASGVLYRNDALDVGGVADLGAAVDVADTNDSLAEGGVENATGPADANGPHDVAVEADTNDSLGARNRGDGGAEVVESSATSAVLAKLRDVLNRALPPVLLLPDALTRTLPRLENPRLFCSSVADSIEGDREYVGIVADLATGADAIVASESPAPPVGEETHTPAGVAAAVASPPPAGIAAAHYVAAQTVRTGMPSESNWTLTISDARGHTVRRLHGNGGPGFVEIRWDGRGDDGQPVTTGEYVYHFATAGYEETRQMRLGE